MVNIREVGINVFLIDDELYSIPGAGAVYFLTEDKRALVDTGPATSAEVILRGIQQAGFKSEEIDYIILTHIHLDHAGGTGTLLQHMPLAKVLVHHRAIKHLVDPSKLVNSAIEAQGKDTKVRNGEVLPVDGGRIVSIRDGDSLKLSDNQSLTFIEAPGHAPHEICIYESRNRGLFVGDAVGHHIEGTDVMVPITPPPGFDLELYINSLKRLIELKPSMIYFAHSGVSHESQKKLESAIRKLLDRDRLITQAVAEHDLEHAVERVVNHVCAELEYVKENMRAIFAYWASVDIPMSVTEHLRYYRRKHGL
jgi:glyoxylase-like metal-dependent hydrolase (beta-lactamase superfamily II)